MMVPSGHWLMVSVEVELLKTRGLQAPDWIGRGKSSAAQPSFSARPGRSRELQISCTRAETHGILLSELGERRSVKKLSARELFRW